MYFSICHFYGFFLNNHSIQEIYFCSLRFIFFLFTENPDSVTITVVNHTGPMVAGKEYQLLCEVQNVAPVQYLNLRWYRERSEVHNRSFTELTSPSPVQISSIFVITPSDADDGARYSCVAELELGPEGPQPPLTVTSKPLRASVHCKFKSPKSMASYELPCSS